MTRNNTPRAQDQPSSFVPGRTADSSEADPLVTSPIKEQIVLLYPQTIKIKRPMHGPPPTPPLRLNTELQGFSTKSRSRLRFTGANSDDKIKTQYCMTYGDVWPINGRSLKADMHRFLVTARRKFENLEYLWIAEFQSRGCPHFHFFSNIEHTPENHETLNQIWHKIAGYGQDKHLRVHGHKSNFIPWAMRTGSYLCKYLDKEHQKAIPAGFTSFGRWWGNSRQLVPEPTEVDLAQISATLDHDRIDYDTGEVDTLDAVAWIIRQVGRHHEHVNRRSFFRRTSRSTSSLVGANIWRQCQKYLQSRANESTPF